MGFPLPVSLEKVVRSLVCNEVRMIGGGSLTSHSENRLRQGFLTASSCATAGLSSRAILFNQDLWADKLLVELGKPEPPA